LWYLVKSGVSALDRSRAIAHALLGAELRLGKPRMSDARHQNLPQIALHQGMKALDVIYSALGSLLPAAMRAQI
jgi:hypothetical protein